MPDVAAVEDSLPAVEHRVHTGPEFRIRINKEGDIFRDDRRLSRSDLVDELRSLPNVADFALVIEGDADVRVAIVTELQTYLSESVPEIGSATFVEVREPDAE